MAIKGAILGDIIGSQFELDRCKDPEGGSLFTSDCDFTDDTVTSLAVKNAVDKKIGFAESLKDICSRYPYCGYGGRFDEWVFSDSMEPYGSWGNGSAMRVSYIGEHFEDLKEVQEMARKSAEVTHNAPEGIKGAVVTATCIWMARHGKTKEEIYEYVLQEYPADEYKYSIADSVDELETRYTWDVSCQGSVPVAMRCFYESDSYEGFIRNVWRLNCDCDTLCCIGGGVAEEFYGGSVNNADEMLELFLTEDLYEILYGS